MERDSRRSGDSFGSGKASDGVRSVVETVVERDLVLAELCCSEVADVSSLVSSDPDSCLGSIGNGRVQIALLRLWVCLTAGLPLTFESAPCGLRLA